VGRGVPIGGTNSVPIMMGVKGKATTQRKESLHLTIALARVGKIWAEEGALTGWREALHSFHHVRTYSEVQDHKNGGVTN